MLAGLALSFQQLASFAAAPPLGVSSHDSAHDQLDEIVHFFERQDEVVPRGLHCIGWEPAL